MFTERLVNLRNEKKLTQTEVSERIGVSRATLAHYEQGRSQPDFETLIKIADFFKVTTDHLLGRDLFVGKADDWITFMHKNVNELEIVIKDILKIAELNEIDSAVMKALELVYKIESEHRLADILSDERQSLLNISNSLGNLKMQAATLKDIIFSKEI